MRGQQHARQNEREKHFVSETQFTQLPFAQDVADLVDLDDPDELERGNTSDQALRHDGEKIDWKPAFQVVAAAVPVRATSAFQIPVSTDARAGSGRGG